MPPGSNGAMRGRIVGGRGRVKGSESVPPYLHKTDAASCSQLVAKFEPLSAALQCLSQGTFALFA